MMLRDGMKPQPHLGRRALAALLDYGLYFGLVWAYLINVGEWTGVRYEVHGCSHLVPLAGAWLVLIPLLEGLLGFTLGKGLFGLQVVDMKGRKVSPLTTFYRHCLDIPDFFLFGVVAATLVWRTPNHQRLGDLVARTRVVTDREVKAMRTVSDTFA
jgi:uncharacterized RDD family membrane protein YckC